MEPRHSLPAGTGRGARIAWLAACCALTLAMIVLGGVVRLTRSGLSITEWNPVSGALPPMSPSAWAHAFAEYRATPEYRLVNPDFGMAQFRSIFLLEYAHRLLGRVTGLVLAVPLVALLARRRLSLRRARPLLAILALGAVQGALGWFMVESGLVDEPRVSPFRLTAHLLVGMAIFAALVWMLLDELDPGAGVPVSRQARRAGRVLVVTVFVAIAWGALMAGNHAGYVFATFPTMNGAWLPIPVETLVRGCTTSAVAIHVTHRLAALAVSIAVLLLAWATRGERRTTRALVAACVALVAVQVTLGALVVVDHVPVPLASLHQANAVVLVALVTALARRLRAPARARVDMDQLAAPARV